MDQNFFEPEAHFESNGDVFVKEKWRSMSATSTVPENGSGCFECNICLDSANEPVVTLCGHLYCWPCIYKWLHVQSNMNEPDQQNCPVCKANISHASLVPLYGRGTSHWDSETKKPQLDLVIPRRPLPSGLNTIITSTTTSTSQQNHHLNPNNFQSNLQSRHQQYFPYPYGAYVAGSLPSSRLGATVMTSLITPTIAIFGEMVFARMFGNLGTSLFPYPPTGSSGPRMRRHEMRFDRSLNRVSIFLFCCFILCLLLF